MERGSGLATPEELPTDCVRTIRPPGEPNTIVLVFSGRIGRADIKKICERARPILVGGDDGLIICDVSAVVEPDAVTIDALARLQLTARRLGHEVVIRYASHQLVQLLEFTGLRGVVLLSES